jgi:hypothetical protein
MRSGVAIYTVTVVFFALNSQAQKHQRQSSLSPASPQAVCSFITSHMTSALPQVPTLCYAKLDKLDGIYDISIVSSNDVLEGNLRRAWSSSLFQLFEQVVMEKSLGGACGTSPVCIITVSDARMSIHNLSYRIFLDKHLVESTQAQVETFHGTPLSEQWYLAWWEVLMANKESGYPGSEENARQIGLGACHDYLRALAKRIEAQGKTPPNCAVMLATPTKVYISIEFDSLLSAVLISSSGDLPDTFGKAFSNTGYDGQVIIRSPYVSTVSGDARVYKIYPLRPLEFVYEEERGGLRTEAEGNFLLESRYSDDGQTSAQSLLLVDPKYDGLIRFAAVFEFPNGGNDHSRLVDLTDGAEWRISDETFTRCGVTLGSELTTVAGRDQAPTLTIHNGSNSCRLDATFVKGW